MYRTQPLLRRIEERGATRHDGPAETQPTSRAAR